MYTFGGRKGALGNRKLIDELGIAPGELPDKSEV